MSTRTKPIFVTYIFPKRVKAIIIAIFISLIPLYAVFVFLGLPVYSQYIIVLILATIGAIAIKFLAEKQEFYEDSIKLFEGNLLKMTLPYSGIVKVGYWGKRLGKRNNFRFIITIQTDTIQKDLKIATNPLNNKRKIDLFTWLSEKITNMQQIERPK